MTQFEDIRPYDDAEVQHVLKALASDEMFGSVVGKLYSKPGAKEHILKILPHIQSIEEFQKEVIYPLIVQIEKNTTDGISFSKMDQFQTEGRYLFISNHRDIILDSAFLNAMMHKHGFSKTEIAIGDNLLIFDWIKKLARLNRTFIVKRNLGIRDQLNASRILSDYIRYAINIKGESVWIAQREGRTKDGNDQTQQALLKMLNMSNNNSMVEGFKELNIVPMAISYEIEPCGISKVEELLNRKYKPDFAKTQQDDLQSMANGVMLPKGRVHFGFGNPLNIKIDALTEGKNNNEVIHAITNFIDQRIYFNYKLWPNNYIAADLLNQTKKYQQHYTAEQKDNFILRMEKEAVTLTFKHDEIIEMYLKMYANPVINFERFFDV
jgi:hypothetical protein